jgi:hypothetical protein
MAKVKCAAEKTQDGNILVTSAVLGGYVYELSESDV